MSRWCNNHTQPSVLALDKMAMVLDVNRQEQLEKKARAEKQPRRKMELVEEIKKLMELD